MPWHRAACSSHAHGSLALPRRLHLLLLHRQLPAPARLLPAVALATLLASGRSSLPGGRSWRSTAARVQRSRTHGRRRPHPARGRRQPPLAGPVAGAGAVDRHDRRLRRGLWMPTTLPGASTGCSPRRLRRRIPARSHRSLRNGKRRRGRPMVLDPGAEEVMCWTLLPRVRRAATRGPGRPWLCVLLRHACRSHRQAPATTPPPAAMATRPVAAVPTPPLALIARRNSGGNWHWPTRRSMSRRRWLQGCARSCGTVATARR